MKTLIKPSVIALAVWMLCWLVQVGRAAESPSMAVVSAPDFTLQSLDAKAISLGQLRDKVIVLHFAATWCPFCNAEAPHLEKLQQRYKDQGVQVLIIDVKESKALVEKMARKFGFSFPVLLDPDGSVATSYAPPKNVLPDLARDEVVIASNLIIDRQGKIQFFSVLDTTNFDAKLIALQSRLDQVLAAK